MIVVLEVKWYKVPAVHPDNLSIFLQRKSVSDWKVDGDDTKCHVVWNSYDNHLKRTIVRYVNTLSMTTTCPSGKTS